MTTNGFKPKVVLADDHPGMLNRVVGFLSDSCNIVATVSDGAQAVQAALEHNPDIIVLDITMPQVDGMQAAREIRRIGLNTKIIFLTVQEDADYVETARTMGASYVLKPRLHVDLLAAMKEVAAGRMFVSPFSVLATPK
jgi:two-component system, NarL family, response regulator DegU